VFTNRPDFSAYLAHFTKDGEPVGKDKDDDPTNQFAPLTAGERLVSMLKGGVIKAGRVPWIGRHAVCFTECPWSSLLDHANQYSSFAIGFTKPRVFAAGGGPAYYVRADHWEKQEWDPHLKTFATPFWPSYRPKTLQGSGYLSGKTIDYSQEREWRVPHDFTFKLDQVEFVILPTYKDMAEFPKELKDAIGREKFLLMEVYRNVERLWPVHNIDG
jgi:Putative abortive phage resistance protein AbiGi, antitoxin